MAMLVVIARFVIVTCWRLLRARRHQLGDRLCRRDLRALKQHAKWHLHDPAASSTSGVNVREPALFKFSDGARINGHARKGL
jgi:hypothetical protein